MDDIIILYMAYELLVKKKTREKLKNVGTSIIKHSFIGRSIFNYFSRSKKTFGKMF